VLTRLHSECLTGDVLGSRRCDCGPQLQASLAAIMAAGGGVAVYLRGHEGRGIGLLHKLRAYALQDAGATPSTRTSTSACRPTHATTAPAPRSHRPRRGVRTAADQQPGEVEQLTRYGIEVTERVPVVVLPTEQNLAYLRTKAERMGHDLSHVLEGTL
jgi:3,4-dihydroxy 2-butanone 4-phosphate synthase/GTP cyclohydrolase II